MNEESKKNLILSLNTFFGRYLHLVENIPSKLYWHLDLGSSWLLFHYYMYIIIRWPCALSNIQIMVEATLFYIIHIISCVMEIIKKKNGQRRYKYLVLGKDRSYFVKKNQTLILPKSSLKLISSTSSSFWLTTYLLSLVDVFFNRQSEYLWVQICAPLLAHLFFYSYEADFIQGLLKKNEKKLARSFNFTFRYIDDVLSLNNSSLMISLIASIPLSLK